MTFFSYAIQSDVHKATILHRKKILALVTKMIHDKSSSNVVQSEFVKKAKKLLKTFPMLRD